MEEGFLKKEVALCLFFGLLKLRASVWCCSNVIQFQTTPFTYRQCSISLHFIDEP